VILEEKRVDLEVNTTMMKDDATDERLRKETVEHETIVAQLH
jgi:hypothetical protein